MSAATLTRYPAGRRDLLDKHFTIPYGDKYNIKVLGTPKVVLGIEITRNMYAGTLKISQGKYIKKIYEKYCVGRTTKDCSVPVHNAGIIPFHELKKGTAANRDAMGA